MARRRYIMFVTDGMLTAATNAIKDSALDPRGGGLSTFAVPLEREGGAGTPWWGASWVMEESGLGTISFEEFLATVVGPLNMKHNTGAANVQLCTYVTRRVSSDPPFPEDEFPGLSPGQAFQAALADTTKKPWPLAELPFDDARGNPRRS